jgi:hypothetical protein
VPAAGLSPITGAQRPLGTMIVYGFPNRKLEAELELAIGLGPTQQLYETELPIADCRFIARTAAGAGRAFAPRKSTWARRTQRSTKNRSTT